MKLRRVAVVCAFMLVLAGAPAWAQVSTSTITGTVQDATGALVAGAKVVATHEATGATHEVTTTSAGAYTIPSLPPGLYTITVTMSGFRTFSSKANVLTVAAPLVVNVTLEVGAVAEVVEVQATYARIDTTSAMLSGVVSRREVVDLPLNGRNPLNLIILEPGLVQRTGGAAGSGTHVFGSRDRAHNVTIDGIEANESSVPNPQSNLHRLNPDNVQEYRVVTHNATPEFGRNSGANVSIATRSGTNEFHGDLFWFHRNTVLNANEWFNNYEGIERPTLLLHQFGAAGGGPIVKNKTFFYVSWQGNRIKQSMPIAASFGTPWAYTDLAKQGLFRYFVPDPANPLIIDGTTMTRNSTRLVDSRTGALRAGVVMCATPTSVGCIRTYNIFASDPALVGPDPLMKAMFDSFPSPNMFSVGDGLNFGGYSWNPPSRFVGPHYMARIDHKFNENNNLFGRMLWSDWNTTLGDFLNLRPSTFPDFAPQGTVSRRSRNLAISYRRVFSPRWVNEYTMGFSRFRFTFGLAEANMTPGYAKQPAYPLPYGQECFGTDSLGNVDTPFCNTPHTQRSVNTFQFIDNLSYVRGAHSFRMGFNIRLYQHNDERGVPGGFNMTPTIIYSQSIRPPTANTYPGVAAGFPSASGIHSSDGSNLAQTIVEMMGIPARVQAVYVGGMPTDTWVYNYFHAGTRAKQYNFYFQDEWKIRRNLTMTYGVRWELNPPPTDSHDRVFAPDRAWDGSQGLVTYVRAADWFERKNRKAIAPRLSLAWDPWSTGKSVFRFGYGIAFDTISTFQVTAINGKVPGSVLQCRVDVQAGATLPPSCKDIPNNVRLSGMLAVLNWTTFDPFDFAAQGKIIGPPTGAPSAALSPAVNPSGIAPGVGAFDRNLKIPTVHEWSLTVQRELKWAFTGQVGYIGKRGTRLYRAYDLNQDNIPSAFLSDFIQAQKNLYICRTNAAACIAAGSVTKDNFANFGLPGQADVPVLSALLGSGATPAAKTDPMFRSSSYVTAVSRNGVGDLAALIDARSGTGWFKLRTNPVTLQPFPVNYFRPNAQFTDFFYFDSGGSSHYHGMIIQLQRKYEKGLIFGLSYTLSKSIDDMSVDPVAATSGGGLTTTNSRTPSDVRNMRLDRSRSDFDNTHVLVVHALYDLPFGRGQRWGSGWSSWVNHLLGGWTVTGIYTFQSGEPFTINAGVRTAHQTKQARAILKGPMPSTKLQFVPGIEGPVVFNADTLIEDSTSPYNNCRRIIGTDSYFCIPGPMDPGMGRNVVQGPGFWNFDMGIIKKFSITERFKLDFRTEFFNLFNHPNFENPRNATVGSPTLTSGLFGQTGLVTASVPSSSTIIAIGEPNRVIQFALRVSF